MKALDPDRSWRLFLKTINKFTSDEQYKFPKHLEKKGREMLTKCGGLPVAIIDVGRQKAKQRLSVGIEWEELLELDSIDLGASLELLESSYRKLESSFELLNILDLEDFGLKILSETIGTTLIKLKYLGLRNNYIQEIPRSLGCLKKLMVFDIAQNFMVEVPDIIWEMDSLRRIYMSDVICRKPLKIDMLENLESLTYISINNWAYDEFSGLEKMISLRKLGIEEVSGNSDVSKLFASLSKLKRLYCLILRGFRFRSMPCLDELGILDHLGILKLDGLLARLPSANNFPPKICKLSLVNTCLDEDPMPVLEKLSHLTHLRLRNAYTGRQMVIHHDGFPDLRKLCIEELWNLRNVRLGQGGMRKPNQLEINYCPCLESLPEEIGSMAYLKELKMVTTKNIATKIENSGFISKIKDVDTIPLLKVKKQIF